MKHHIVLRLLVLTLCLLIANGPGEQTTGQTPPAGAPTNSNAKAIATGQTIGTIVSTAVNTAFPIIGKIMDLFKKQPEPATTTSPADKKKNGGTPPTTTTPEKTATESEVRAAVTKAEADARKAFKEQIQPTATFAKELAVVQTFGDGAALANQNIAAIQRMLAAPKPDYSRIDSEWKKLNKHLAKALTVKEADIRTVREVSIQAKLLALQKSQDELMSDITDNIGRAATKPDFPKTELQTQISAMALLLNGFDSLTAAELGVLQSDIENLSIWANTPAGPESLKMKPADPQLIQVANDAIDAIDGTLHKRN